MTESNTNNSLAKVQIHANIPKSKKTYQIIPNDTRKKLIERVSSQKVTIKQVKNIFSLHKTNQFFF